MDLVLVQVIFHKQEFAIKKKLDLEIPLGKEIRLLNIMFI